MAKKFRFLLLDADSLEEILHAIGRVQPGLARHFTKQYRENIGRQGFADGVTQGDWRVGKDEAALFNPPAPPWDPTSAAR